MFSCFSFNFFSVGVKFTVVLLLLFVVGISRKKWINFATSLNHVVSPLRGVPLKLINKQHLFFCNWFRFVFKV